MIGTRIAGKSASLRAVLISVDSQNKITGNLRPVATISWPRQTICQFVVGFAKNSFDPVI